MSEDIIERAAQAAYENWRAEMGFGAGFPPWVTVTPVTRELWVASQRAAIAALRDPSEAMQTAGAYQRENGKPVADIWNSMIDAALGKPATEGEE